jgi:hypothetical protein
VYRSPFFSPPPPSRLATVAFQLISDVEENPFFASNSGWVEWVDRVDMRNKMHYLSKFRLNTAADIKDLLASEKM